MQRNQTTSVTCWVWSHIDDEDQTCKSVKPAWLPNHYTLIIIWRHTRPCHPAAYWLHIPFTNNELTTIAPKQDQPPKSLSTWMNILSSTMETENPKICTCHGETKHILKTKAKMVDTQLKPTSQKGLTWLTKKASPLNETSGFRYEDQYQSCGNTSDCWLSITHKENKCMLLTSPSKSNK